MLTKNLYDQIDALIIEADRHEVPYITLSIVDAIKLKIALADAIDAEVITNDLKEQIYKLENDCDDKDKVIEEFENQVENLLEEIDAQNYCSDDTED